MGWEDLLQQDDERVVSAWLGGRSLRLGPRLWTIVGRLPREHGWFEWKVEGTKVSLVGPADPLDEGTLGTTKGYLVGDRIIPDGVVPAGAPLNAIFGLAEPVFFIEPGLDRFTRARAGRFWYEGPLLYLGQDFPLGPEEDVLTAFLEPGKGISEVPGVSPSLDLAFRLESWHRAETERRRREEQERREREERLRAIQEKLGDGQGRRELAQKDFGEAAKAALAVGGATLLDWRPSRNPREYVVRFRCENRRFEVVCDQRLHITDLGICLTDHETGVKGDTWFTLESAPSVIRQAIRENKLVVWRHVD